MNLTMNVEDIRWHDSGIDEIIFLKEKGEIHFTCEFNQKQNLGMSDGMSELVKALVIFKGIENLQLTQEIHLFAQNPNVAAEVLKATFHHGDKAELRTCNMFIIITNFNHKPPLNNYGSITFDYGESHLKIIE